MFTLKPHYAVAPVAFLFFLGILHALNRRRRRHRLVRGWSCKPPTSKLPVRDPILGLDFLLDSAFGSTSDQYVEPAYQRFKRLGKTYVAERWTITTIYTCDSANIKHMLASEFESFDLPAVRVSALSSFLGAGIFSLSGPRWAHSRKIWRPSLTKSSMAPLRDILEKNFQAFLSHIPQDGSTVALGRLFFWLTMDIATEYLFDNSTDMLNRAGEHDTEQQFIDDYMLCSSGAIKRMQLGPLGPIWQSQKLRKAKERIFSYIDGFIEDCLKREHSGHERAALGTADGRLLDRTDMRDQVLHILLASRDTTASVLGNLFFSFGKKPEIFDKVRMEVVRIAGEDCPTEEQLRRMEYLRWCVQESLRLHPVIPTNAREAIRDIYVPHGGGADGLDPLFVPKGTTVMYNVYAMHRDEAVFGKRPTEFLPERWEGLRPGWGFLPFNGGPRICLGQQFAQTELLYVVARIAQIFKRIEGRDDREWLELYALAMTCQNEIKVGLFRSQ